MRTVLFLGAGASRPFGFPMTAEILPEILLSRFAPALFETEVDPPLITLCA